MLSTKEIRELISKDDCSRKKKNARVGQRYFEGKHDILNYRLFYFDSDGNLREDRNRSNVKIPHPFFTEIVDQSVQYIFSGGRFARSEDMFLQEKLDEYFNYNDDFTSELQSLLQGCMVKGFEYLYMYRNGEGRLTFQKCDSLKVVEVSEKNSEDGERYLIFSYTVTAEKGRKEIEYIQVWSENEVGSFKRVNGGEITADDDIKPNPRSHILYSSEDGNTYCESFGMIPFFRLDNDQSQRSDLEVIKALIDDYDLMASSLSNNLIDFDTPLYAVTGFEGDSLDELSQNLRTKKMIGLDEGGKVEIKTVAIPFEARQAKLELDEKNIYRFGMGLNTAGLRDTVSTTNIAIKAAYSLLDLKCAKLETRLKQFLRRILKPVLSEINMNYSCSYSPSDVWFEFKHEIMSNALENARIQQIKASAMKMYLENLKEVSSVMDEDKYLAKVKEAMEVFEV